MPYERIKADCAAIERAAKEVGDLGEGVWKAVSHVEEKQKNYLDDCFGDCKSSQQFLNGPDGFRAGAKILHEIGMSLVDFLRGGEGLSSGLDATAKVFRAAEDLSAAEIEHSVGGKA
ncbi:hypothetical protein OH799_18685 [Nocardia sp. NBC_00881]|uniref:hypothetical protein n=1 Tax=Nocardia sp. NBC_00881 TaxID=2975995 RepID=UPI00386DCA04|nr:hypothetical protein OH799_18685 [Nocardia sp. NBC_00881]